MTASISSDDSRTYSRSTNLLIPAIIFTSMGVGLAVWIAYHLLSGVPLMLSNGKSSQHYHLASTSEIATIAFGAVSTTVCGILTALAWKNMHVVTNTVGITATDFLGRTKFRAFWQDLERMEERSGRRGRYFLLESRGKRLEISTSYSDHLTLIEEIRDRAPHLVENDNG